MKLHWLIENNIIDENLIVKTSDVLIDNKAVLIRNFSSKHIEFIDFISEIGDLIKDPRNNDLNFFEIKVEGLNGQYSSYANCPYFFPLHTDCSDYCNIPNSVALYCISPSQVGGESIVAAVKEIVEKLDNDLKNFLLNHYFKMRDIKRPILYKTDNNTYKMIYNRLMIQNFSETNEFERLQLDRLDDICNEVSSLIKLKKDDLLILRNDTMLHGRTAFNEKEKRLLKRVRFNLKLKDF